MAETEFLSFLVDETLKLQKSGEIELSSLELKLKDYNLRFLKGEFIPQSQVLRFITQFGVLDIPINWSVFSLDCSDTNDIIISKDNDKDHLLDIFKMSWSQDLNQLVVTHADGFCYIVGLKSGEEYYIHDILNPQEILRAA